MKIETQLKILIIVALVALIICCLYSVTPQPETNTYPPRVVEPPQSARAPAKLDTRGFCLGGCPAGDPDDQIVVHHVLELASNPKTKFADWVAYKITAATLGSGCKRIWAIDPDLDPATTLDPRDYRNIRKALQSDRGHQAPLASLCGSPYWYEADYLSNITPQKTDLNEGEWEHLEEAERKLIKDGVAATVYSITGTLYETEMPSLPFSHLANTVPSGYWKVVSLDDHGKIIAAAFAIPQNAPREADYCRDTLTIASLEDRTHLKFFPELADETRAAISTSDIQKKVLAMLGCGY